MAAPHSVKRTSLEWLAHADGGPWKTILTSPEQRKTAYQDQPPPFDARVVHWQAADAAALYRALVVISWYHGDAV